MSIGSRVFDPPGSKNRGVPLTRRVALTTVLQYRADCDMAKAMCFVASLTITKAFDCVDYWLLFYKLFDKYDIKQEILLPQRAQRVRRAQLVNLMTFLGRKSEDG